MTPAAPAPEDPAAAGDDALGRLTTLLARAQAAPGGLDLTGTDDPAGVTGPQGAALDAHGWSDLALEAALREEPADVVRCAESGLLAPGGDQPGTRLTLLRQLALAADQADDEDALARRVEERADVLRALGRPHQAALETQLGAALVREPDGFEAAVLAGVVEDERRRRAQGSGGDPADTVLPEALLGLAVQRIHESDLDGALVHLREAIALLRELRAAGAALPSGTWASAHLVLARLHLWRGEHAEAEVEALTVLSLPAARAVRASALLVRAIAAHEQGRPDDALRFALDATAGMGEAGLRRGAASAAALVARAADDGDRQEAAVLAWRLAAVHAEKAEAPEAAVLTYWWAHQLVLAGRPQEAEPVLEGLVRRAAAGGQAVEQARALVDLGHALHDQDRSVEALPLWREAADLFEAHGQAEDAARVLLAAGALVNRERDAASRPLALDLFERAATAARRAADEAGEEDDGDVLPAALHALGYLLCESGRPEGLALLDEAIALAEQAPAPWQAADFLDTRARALWALENGPEAVSTALTSADRFTAAGDPNGAAQAELFAAYVVAEDGRPEQAATLFRLVGDSTGSDLVRLGALTGLHQCLDALGDHAGAARVRDDLESVRARLGVSGD
ncbi:hypothetical protein AB0302_09890 [Micrococcus sp. NPDC078436]|uniref:hypothetical protein n=1 Tax=Micrococcus sp. NPDC078436 TaxID=3154960 RepID=UPI00344EBA35